MNNLVNIFEVGKVYEMRFIGDNDLRPRFKCIARTAKSAKFERLRGGAEVLTRRIKSYDGSEYVLEGSYSMAPSINAKHVVTE